MKRRITVVVLAMVILAMVAGCAMFGGKSFTSMTPKEKATFFMGTYNRQYDSYKVDVVKPNRTAEDNKALATRKEILTKVYPLISTYDLAANSGQPITKAQEDAIMALFNQLAGLVVK